MKSIILVNIHAVITKIVWYDGYAVGIQALYLSRCEKETPNRGSRGLPSGLLS